MSMDELMKNIEETRKTIGYAEEVAIIDFTEAICEGLESSNMTRKQLADKVGLSEEYINEILRGGLATSSIALIDMVTIIHATGYVMKIGKEKII